LDWCQDAAGVPRCSSDLRRQVPFNDVAALESALSEFGPVAAIVIEPVVEGEPAQNWLSRAREAAVKTGAVLIFDEIKTAFRIAPGGAAERYGVIPDIAVVGKALGNGFPLAAVCGSKELMAAVNRTWISSTLATEYVSLGAARAVLDVYERENVTAAIREAGRKLMAGLEAIAERLSECGVRAKGTPEMCFLDFEDSATSAAFASSAARHGVIFKRDAYNFVSYSHGDRDIIDVVARLDAAAEEVKRNC
jgi:glutamate-1-semialdehyde aminotransferase